MLQRRILFTGYVSIIILCVLLVNSCNVIVNSSRGDYTISKKNIHNSKKPKVVQLKPSDCPWNKTYVIKNERKHKVYGAKYAKKQNRKLKNAL